MLCLQARGWQGVPVPSKGWGEMHRNELFKNLCLNKKYIYIRVYKKYIKALFLYFFTVLRRKWAPGSVLSSVPFQPDQETRREVRRHSAVPWRCLPSPPAQLMLEVSPCATKMGKRKIVRRGSASLARKNRTLVKSLMETTFVKISTNWSRQNGKYKQVTQTHCSQRRPQGICRQLLYMAYRELCFTFSLICSLAIFICHFVFIQSIFHIWLHPTMKALIQFSQPAELVSLS